MECKEIHLGTIVATTAWLVRSPQQYSTVKCCHVYLDLEQKLPDRFCKIFHNIIFRPEKMHVKLF